jgi:hypothetical protein
MSRRGQALALAMMKRTQSTVSDSLPGVALCDDDIE